MLDPSTALFIFVGLVAGLLSGVFGIGGGVVIVPALIYLAGFTQHRATGTSLAVLLPPIGFAAMWEYYRHDNVNVSAAMDLLKWHDEGQLPYEPLVREQPHADAVVRGCENWLREHFRRPGVVARVVGHAQVPERTLKRRFKQATGLALIDYVQNLRIEDAKRLLETTDTAVDEICFAVGYEDPSFFRRLFRRRTGVAPARYRRVFQPIHRGIPAVPPVRKPGSRLKVG